MKYERPKVTDLGSIADHTFIGGKFLAGTVDNGVENSASPLFGGL